MKQKVMAVVHDPGGTKALIPVLCELKRLRGVELQVFAGPFAQSFLKEHGILFKKMKSNVSAKECEKYFDSFHPNKILTATSWNSNLEQQFRNHAHQKNIPSVVLVDYWDGYKKRWLGSTYSIAKMHDVVAVVDSSMKRQMVELGFPARLVKVTGHPFLEKLSARSKKIKQTKGKTIRLLFLSEPITPRLRKRFKIHPLETALNAMTEIPNLEIHFKFHPKEVLTAETRKILGRYKKIKILNYKGPFADLVLKHDAVFGYRSMGLIEAKILGKPVVAMPFLRKKEGFYYAVKQHKIKTAGNSKKEIVAALKKTLEQKSDLAFHYKNATKKIVGLVL